MSENTLPKADNGSQTPGNYEGQTTVIGSGCMECFDLGNCGGLVFYFEGEQPCVEQTLKIHQQHGHRMPTEEEEGEFGGRATCIGEHPLAPGEVGVLYGDGNLCSPQTSIYYMMHPEELQLAVAEINLILLEFEGKKSPINPAFAAVIVIMIVVAIGAAILILISIPG